MDLLATITITAAGTVTGPLLTFNVETRELNVISDFVYGSGGTTCKIFLQTKIGSVWTDVMNHAFTVSSAKKISSIRKGIALAPSLIPTDGTLTDDTIIDGLLGLEFRIKVISTGTYAGGTTITVKGN